MIQSDKDFLAIAMKSYDNPSCVSITEFESDIRKIQYCRKLIRKIHSKEEVNLRILVNTLVVFFNMFGNVGTDMLIWKIKEPELLEILFPILSSLGRVNDALLALPLNNNDDMIQRLRTL